MKIKYVLEDILSFRYNIISIFAGLIPFKKLRQEIKSKITNEKGRRKIESSPKRINCQIGKYTYCDKSLYVGNKNTVIGKYCSIGRDVAISPGAHPSQYLSSSPYFYTSLLGWRNEDEYKEMSTPCHIGNDVWIGHGAFIKDGVIIGDGAIIAGGAVVVKDVPPYAIAGGVPAKIIKYRFDDETIKRLLELKWWDMDEAVLKKAPYKDINKAIDFLENYKKGN